MADAEEEYDDNLDEDTKSANFLKSRKKKQSAEEKKALAKSNVEDIIAGTNNSKN